MKTFIGYIPGIGKPADAIQVDAKDETQARDKIRSRYFTKHNVSPNAIHIEEVEAEQAATLMQQILA